MKRDDLIHTLFGTHWQPACVEEHYFQGTALLGAHTALVIGTAERAEVGVDLCLRMAAAVLECIREHPGRPILFCLDTQGQRLRRRDELLGLNGYMAHLAKCVELARAGGHPVISVVYGEAVSGGYLTTGMMADACYALADAEIKVMNLPAMARITKIPLERLEELAGESPVFSPGVDNYLRMGHLQAVWQDDAAQALTAALDSLDSGKDIDSDPRMHLGAERGGRSAALRIVEDIVRARP